MARKNEAHEEFREHPEQGNKKPICNILLHVLKGERGLPPTASLPRCALQPHLGQVEVDVRSTEPESPTWVAAAVLEPLAAASQAAHHQEAGIRCRTRAHTRHLDMGEGTPSSSLTAQSNALSPRRAIPNRVHDQLQTHL